MYIVFPEKGITITINFGCLPSSTTNDGTNEARMMTIKLSKTKPSKTTRKAKNFLYDLFTLGDERIKRM